MPAAETINIDKAELASMLQGLIASLPPRLPRYFRFPEDIRQMLGNKPAVSTVLNWRTSYGLKVTKIGTGAYVFEDDWFHWVANNKTLMAANDRSRGKRLGRRP